MRNTSKLHLGPLALALFAGACLLSCEETPLSEVFVYYTADDALAEQAGCLRVDVFSIENPADPGVPLAPVIENLAAGGLPVRLALSPASNDARTGYRLAAELFAEPCDVAAEFARSLGMQDIVSTFVQNEKREIWVVFDTDCAEQECPAGFRCREGVCVEHCVEPEEPAAFEGEDPKQSAPVACGEPCTEDVCEDDRIESCTEDGWVAISQECGFGCSSTTGAACTELVPSNVGENFEWQQGLGNLVIGNGEHVVFDTDTGLVTSTEDGETIEVAGIEFQTLDLGTVDVNTVDVDGESTAEVPVVLGIFAMNSLRVLPFGSVEAKGNAGLVILANMGVEVLGSFSADANAERPGPGGFVGGEDGVGCGAFGTVGCGPGGGGRGRPKPCDPCDFPASTGGGGASYGAFGGAGGLIQTESVSPGFAGVVYEAATSPNLLIGGSGGGAGGRSGNVPPGGHGGGAVQISTNGLLRIGVDTTLGASGAGGGKAAGSFGGGAGGSGGMILLEAGSVLFDGANGVARVGTSGGAGGGASAAGADGTPREVPAAGGGGLPFGGDGSNQAGLGAGGGTWSTGGGGGGGAGRVRFNTRAGASDRGALVPFVTPRSDEAFTVGQAATMEPE